MQRKVKDLSLLALLSAFMLIFGYLEKIFPLVPALPAIKLGLSNIVLLFALVLLGAKSAWSLVFVKVLLGGILYMGPVGTLLAGAGTVCSMLLMQLLLKKRGFSLLFVSMLGSLSHMLAQLIVQSFLIGYVAVLGYAPILLVTSLLSGIFVGYLARLVLTHISNILPEYKNKIHMTGVLENGKH